MKDTEWSGLMKLPDREVIKIIRVKLGQANAYIQELKEELEKNRVKKTYKDALEQANNRIENIQKQLDKSRKECNKVVEENIRLKKQLFKNETK